MAGLLIGSGCGGVLYRGLTCLFPNSGKNFWFRQGFPPGILCRAIPENPTLASLDLRRID
jgi:hypothetical protein